MSASGAGGWLEPNLFWKPAPFFFPAYEAYVVWHYFGFNVDPHFAAPGDGLVGYGAEVKFSLDDPPIVVFRLHWTGGTVDLEEFTKESTDAGTWRVYYTDVHYAVDAQELVATLLQTPAFWREQLDRYWGGTEGSGGSDGPGDDGPESGSP